MPCGSTFRIRRQSGWIGGFREFMIARVAACQARALTIGDLGHPLHISTFCTQYFSVVWTKHAQAESFLRTKPATMCFGIECYAKDGERR
jgi:hypothetical protein